MGYAHAKSLQMEAANLRRAAPAELASAEVNTWEQQVSGPPMKTRSSRGVKDGLGGPPCDRRRSFL